MKGGQPGAGSSLLQQPALTRTHPFPVISRIHWVWQNIINLFTSVASLMQSLPTMRHHLTLSNSKTWNVGGQAITQTITNEFFYLKVSHPTVKIPTMFAVIWRLSRDGRSAFLRCMTHTAGRLVLSVAEGPSSSLYWLLHRLLGDFRRHDWLAPRASDPRDLGRSSRFYDLAIEVI